MLLRRRLGILVVALCLCAGVRLCPAREPGCVVSIQFENDFFGGGTDRHFTHGTRIEALTGPIDWISDAADKLPWFDSKRDGGKPAGALEARASLCVGQNIYTPEDTLSSGLVPEDRPYAGWLYLGLGLVANQGRERYDKLQLEIGVLGPCALGREVQSFWHSLFGLSVPRGWDNQLGNEPGAVLYYEQARRFGRRDAFSGLECDIIPHFGASLGNVFTYAAAGCTVRFGLHLEDDFGPPRIRPSLPGSGLFCPGGEVNAYLFAGFEGRAVLQNVFLDGNTFSDSHSVDRKIFVGDLQVGVTVKVHRCRISYTQIFRSKEFKGQESADIFGSLSFSYHF